METEYDWCVTCDGPVQIVDISDESDLTGPHTETVYNVIHLACGHSLSAKVKDIYFP